MFYYVILCYIMLYYVILCYIMLYYIVLYHTSALQVDLGLVTAHAETSEAQKTPNTGVEFSLVVPYAIPYMSASEQWSLLAMALSEHIPLNKKI